MSKTGNLWRDMFLIHSIFNKSTRKPPVADTAIYLEINAWWSINLCNGSSIWPTLTNLSFIKWKLNQQEASKSTNYQCLKIQGFGWSVLTHLQRHSTKHTSTDGNISTEKITAAHNEFTIIHVTIYTGTNVFWAISVENMMPTLWRVSQIVMRLQ